MRSIILKSIVCLTSIILEVCLATCALALDRESPETYLLASLGLTLEGDGVYWKISNIIKPSFDYQVGDIFVKYGDKWLIGLNEKEAQAILNVRAGAEIPLEVVKKKTGAKRTYQITAARWAKGKLELTTDYSQEKFCLGPGNAEAERQGLRLDDEIISIAGQDISGLSFDAIKIFMSSGVAGEKCEVKVRRDVDMIRKSVTSQGETFGGIGVQISSSSRGIFISNVMDKWPAQEAGVKPEDVIVAIDGQSIINKPFKDAIELLRGKVGTKITLTIERTANIPYNTVGPEYEGVGIEAHFEGGLMLITKIIRGSPAEKAGIEAGDSISSLGGQRFLTERLSKAELDNIFKPTDKEEELIIQRKVTLSGEDAGLSLGKNGLFCMVVSVTESGKAALAGLEEGDMLMEAGGEFLIGSSPASILNLLLDKAPQGIELIIRRKIMVKISNQWFL